MHTSIVVSVAAALDLVVATLGDVAGSRELERWVVAELGVSRSARRVGVELTQYVGATYSDLAYGNGSELLAMPAHRLAVTQDLVHYAHALVAIVRGELRQLVFRELVSEDLELLLRERAVLGVAVHQ